MTSIVDSRAHPVKRCSDMGMTSRAAQQLLGSNLDTMGKLALSNNQKNMDPSFKLLNMAPSGVIFRAHCSRSFE